MPKEEFSNETQEYADLLLEVRKIIRDSGAQQDAKNFVKEQGLELLSELSYSQLEQLKESI
jgi:aspartate/tyrosine/aromatic aminotransferase